MTVNQFAKATVNLYKAMKDFEELLALEGSHPQWVSAKAQFQVIQKEFGDKMAEVFTEDLINQLVK